MCTPEMFAELIEREGIIPAPYLARAMWVQEQYAASKAYCIEIMKRRVAQ